MNSFSRLPPCLQPCQPIVGGQFIGVTSKVAVATATAVRRPFVRWHSAIWWSVSIAVEKSGGGGATSSTQQRCAQNDLRAVPRVSSSADCPRFGVVRACSQNCATFANIVVWDDNDGLRADDQFASVNPRKKVAHEMRYRRKEWAFMLLLVRTKIFHALSDRESRQLVNSFVCCWKNF